MSGKLRYIKVARIDGDGNDITTTLENLTEITLNISAGNRTYPILNSTRHNDYYLYYVNPPGDNDIPALDKSTVKYDFTGSFFETGSYAGGLVGIEQNFSSSINDPLNLFTPNDGLIINTYAQKQYHIILTGSAKFVSSGVGVGSPVISLGKQDQYGNYDYDLAFTNISGYGVYEDFAISRSLDLNPGDRLFIAGFGNSPSGSFYMDPSSRIFITSSAATGDSKIAVLEPYLSQLFYNQGCDVLINNVSQGIPNQFINDLDFSKSTTIPLNFNAIISGSATKSTIPQSHYTQLSSIIPRYLGAKTTSQRINTWTPPTSIFVSKVELGISGSNITLEDKGNFGRSPNVRSLNNVIIFCGWIGGNAPERMDAVTAKIKYLIYQDGTIEKPNLNEFSLANLQNAFRNGENLEVTLTADDITLQNSLSGLRKIIRGGARIENILTTQTGSVTAAPENNFPNDIIVTNVNPLDISNNSTNRFDFNYISSSNTVIGVDGDTPSYHSLLFPEKIYNFANDVDVIIGNPASLWQGNYYQTTPDSNQKGIISTIRYKLTVKNTNPQKSLKWRRRIAVYFKFLDNANPSANLDYLIINKTRTETAGFDGNAANGTGPNNPVELAESSLDNENVVILWTEGQADQWDDEWRAKSIIEIEIRVTDTDTIKEPKLLVQYKEFGRSNRSDPPIGDETGYLEIEDASVRSYQYPAPDETISPAANINDPNAIWSLTSSYATDTNGDNTFTLTSSAAFYGVYGGTYMQETVDGWDFDTITSPIEIQPADEFRFMGQELNTFIVESVEVDPFGNLGFGTIKVTFTKPLPIQSSYQSAGSQATLQWDWFNVRRYTDSSDYVIFQAVKPTGASGTSLIKPQYVVEELDKGVNEIIVDLTERGLIS